MENQSKWSVSVLSSSGFNGDFLPIRQKVIESLREWNFAPVAYELDTYPDNCASVTSNCRQNLSGVDIVLMFITNRYGNFDEECKEKKYSVTRYEYYKACGMDPKTEEITGTPKIVIKLIQKDIHDAYKQYMALSDEEKPQYIEKLKNDGSFQTDYPDLIFEFISELYENKGNGGEVLHEFDPEDVDKLIELIKQLLRNQARNIYLRYILPTQKKYVENFRGGIGSLLSTGEIASNNYYINPQITNVETSDDLLDERIRALLQKGNSMFIYGEAGTGKSTVLTKAFSDHCQEVLENIDQAERFPLFISLSGRNITDEIDLDNYPDYILRTGERKKDKYPFEGIWQSAELGAGFVYYCDAFDESLDAKNGRGRSAVEKLSEKICVITSRPEEYKALIYGDMMNHFSEIIKILGWDSNCLSEYIEKRYATHSETVRNNLIHYLSPSGKVYTPLITVLYLSYLDAEGLVDTFAVPGNDRLVVTQVINNAVRSFLFREEKGSATAETDVSAKEQILCNMGWLINCKRQERITSYTRRQLLDDLKKVCPTESEERLKITIGGFIDVQADEYTTIRPMHDLFIDFFAAKYFYMQAIRQNVEFQEELFAGYLSSEGNRMLREFVKTDTIENQRSILQYLCHMHSRARNASERIIIMYLIPGLVSKNLENDIKPFIKKRYIEDILLRRKAELVPLLNWLTQYGEMKFERKYYKLINTDSKFAAMNRSCYLRYMRQSGSNNPFDYDDRNCAKGDWDFVIRGFAEHFHKNENRHRYIRRVDMTIVRNFIENGYQIYEDDSESKVIWFEGEAYSLLDFYKSRRDTIINDTIFDEYLAKIEASKKIRKKNKQNDENANEIAKEKAKDELLNELELLIAAIEARGTRHSK